MNPPLSEHFQLLLFYNRLSAQIDITFSTLLSQQQVNAHTSTVGLLYAPFHLYEGGSILGVILPAHVH